MRTAGVDCSNLLYFVIIFSHIHACLGGAVNHCIWLNFLDYLYDRITVGYIQRDIRHCRNRRPICYTSVSLCNIGTDTFIPTLLNFVHHVMS